MTHHPRSPQPRTLGPVARSYVWCLLLAIGSGGCAALRSDPGQPIVPTRYETRTGPFTIFTGTPIAPDAPAVRCLGALEHDITSTLGLRVAADDAPVEVYILRDRETFTHFLMFYFPELPPRRAFFIAQGPRRVVYTYNNDRLEEDLRHEATHALLNLAIGDLPLWLDEGLAEYFEGPDGRKGYNPEHVARLPRDIESGWRPDLARLETLGNVRDMTPRDYRESWAWVHYLLNESGPGKNDLLSFLSDLRQPSGSATPLSQRLARSDRGPGQKLLAHIERVRTSPPPAAPVATTPTAKPTTILLQNAPIDPAPQPSTPPRRSFLKTVLGYFGLGGRPS